jgi:cation diffusion facilitator family transporter
MHRVDDCCASKSCEIERLARRTHQRRVLRIVLAINAAMFCIEFAAGALADSTALIADSVDMFGDAAVYALSLYALERGVRWKAGAALAKGMFILAFGIGIFIQAGIKIVYGVSPAATIMVGTGSLALIANVVCLALLWRFRRQDVNMSSTFECSRNDVIANVGVLIAAAGVWLAGSGWPDIAAGLVIAALFLRSAIRVVREAWPQFRSHPADCHEHAIRQIPVRSK